MCLGMDVLCHPDWLSWVISIIKFDISTPWHSMMITSERIEATCISLKNCKFISDVFLVTSGAICAWHAPAVTEIFRDYSVDSVLPSCGGLQYYLLGAFGKKTRGQHHWLHFYALDGN